MRVEFEPVGRRGACPEGETLLDCARMLGVELVNLCGGAASCGRCVVQVVDGKVSEPASSELDYLPAAELAQGFRLACCTVPLGDCKVRVPPESLTTPQRTQVEGEEVPVAPQPAVQGYPLVLAPASLEDLRADAERFADGLAEHHGVSVLSIDLGALRDLTPCLRDEGWRAQAAVRNGEVVAILRPTARLLGLAVDLGTTKIAVYLIDLETGRTLGATGLMNPQISYGEDVIARITHASEGAPEAERLQSLVVDALNSAAASLCGSAGASPTQIVDAVVVGNTAMHHLFLRLPARQLAQAPYVPAVGRALDVRARDLGLQLAPGAYVHLLPNIAGYVGADHVAMILATGMAHAQGVVLALDIGTNTEICLANRGRLTSLSCASGPAFEGAHISHGMRAANGAIERLRLVEDRVEYQTIGDAAPVGLCGSGILDTLAQLYQAGIVEENGRMRDHARVRGERGQKEFVVAGSDENGRKEITFTQKDVRELQLAKGAMRCGLEVLMRANDLVAEQIDQVIIAGAFGTYIDVASAIAIGMLPTLAPDRFRQVGNAAGMGAKLALISHYKRAEAQAIAQRVDYIELATVPGFAQTFAQAMYLGDPFRDGVRGR